MSVDLSVGYLDAMRRLDLDGFAHWRSIFAGISEALAAQGLPPWHEPESLAGEGYYTRINPPNGIAWLQRYALGLWWLNHPPEPRPELGNPLTDPALTRFYEQSYFSPDHRNRSGQNFSHLVCHSARDGCWLPLEFEPVLHVGKRECGSAVKLLEACEAIAVSLELDPADQPEIVAAARPFRAGDPRWMQYRIEAECCLRLAQAAWCALELRAAMVLH